MYVDYPVVILPFFIRQIQKIKRKSERGGGIREIKQLMEIMEWSLSLEATSLLSLSVL